MDFWGVCIGLSMAAREIISPSPNIEARTTEDQNLSLLGKFLSFKQ
jgi:hypothetical protein